jgi:hypothetical protein
MVDRWFGCLLIVSVGSLAAAGQAAQSHSLDLSGGAPVFADQTERSRANLAIVGLRISSAFDDNALNSQQDHKVDLAAFIQPHLGWRVSGPRLDWIADYALGFSRSQEFAAHDSLSHLLDSRLQLRLTKRLKLVVHEVYLNSSNPFDQLQAVDPATGPSGPIVPSVTTQLTPVEVRTDQSSADIAYALSSHSSVGVGGEFFEARYSRPPGNVSSGQLLEDSNSTTGHAFYMRQITRRQWTGLDYHVQKSTLNRGQSSSLVESLAYTHTIQAWNATTISFFVGPERSVTKNVLVAVSLSQPDWQWSAGLVGRWSGKRTTLSSRVSRRIDSGGVLGTAEQTTGSAEMNRKFGRRWSTRLLASYDHDTELVGSGTLRSSSVAGSLTYALGSSLSLELQYWRVHVSGNGSLPAGLLADHNRILISIVYEHRQALGR